MKLIFIRHGDPDYVNDSLTEKGRREAKLLAGWLKNRRIDEIYQSPLGRARDTASYTLRLLEREAETLEWLREFPARIDPNISAAALKAYATELKTDPKNGLYEKRIVWDMLPSYYMDHPELFESIGWRQSAIARESDAVQYFDHAASGLDSLLAEHGYKRDGLIYRTEQGCDKVIAFFCHFAISAVLLSHLMNISPFAALQFWVAAPTSVTEIVTEEREKGIAAFRMLRYGDISHLNMAGEEPSFSARFCEVFENADERH